MKVQCELGDSPGVPGRVGDLTQVWHGSGDPRGRLRQVGGSSRKSVTGRGTVGKVRDGLGDTCGGPGLVGGPYWVSEMGRRPSVRSETGRGTLPKVRS